MSTNDTLPQRLKIVAAEYADLNIILSKNESKEFKPLTYRDFWRTLRILGTGLHSAGIRRGDHVGMISENRKEWMLTDIALLGLGAIDVPRGCDSTADEIEYILAHADCPAVFAENVKQAEKILSRIDRLEQLEKLFLFDAEGSEKLSAPERIKIMSFEELIKLGEEEIQKSPDFFENEIAAGNGDDTATIIYTSGTTGNPKGVMLNHKAFLFQIDRVLPHLDLRPGEIMLSVLPIWHAFERACVYIVMYHGVTTAYSKPVGAIMMPDMQKVKPQWMTSVPRIWESVHSAIMRTVNSENQAKKSLFYFFLSVGEIHTYLYDMFTGMLPQFSKRNRFIEILISAVPLAFFTPFKMLGQVLVFNKLKGKLGGRFKAGISGGGALPSYVDKFFRTVGIVVLEGYGLTETAPILSVRKDRKPIPGTVGPLLADIEYRVVNKDGAIMPIGYKGELHVKSDQIMQGYYKDPEKTAEIIKNGWLNTGDIAVFTHTGEFKILGRSKETIVLRGGENIEPVPIEDKLLRSDFIDQVMVVGQDQKFLAALIVPNLDELEKIAIEKNITYLEKEELAGNTFIKEILNDEIQKLISTKNGFKPFERIFRFEVLSKPFEVGKELTHSLKLRRNVIEKIYRSELKDLFK